MGSEKGVCGCWLDCLLENEEKGRTCIDGLEAESR